MIAINCKHQVLLQGFHWNSWRYKNKQHYRILESRAKTLARNYLFTGIWLPPMTQSVSPQGYLPLDLYNLNSEYGSMHDLMRCIHAFHEEDVDVIGDVVINHRCAQYQNERGVYNVFGGHLSWNSDAIVCDDSHFEGTGNPSSGILFDAAPNIDHSQEFVRRDLIEWMRWLKHTVGYDGFRFDFVRGFDPWYVKEYAMHTNTDFVVGEYWDSMSYDSGGQLEYNQDHHRQRIVDWIDRTDGLSSAFDFTTKGILQHALETKEYWRLVDIHGNCPGVIGWWSQKAITFIDNHDTGNPQNHWPFPEHELIRGYAYILTHPGTPMVYYGHILESNLKNEIKQLIHIRAKYKIHSESSVLIVHASNDAYIAHIDNKIGIMLGHHTDTSINQIEFRADGVIVFPLTGLSS